MIDRRLVIVAGKGGVGRTTVACALAMLGARRGKRMLLCQMRAKNRLARLLGRPIGSEIQAIEPNLWAVNMEPRAALREYGMMVLRFPAVVRAVFDNRPLRAFLRAVPGLYEFALLGKACHHARDRERFDTVVLDGPATGHLVPMLRLPRSVAEVMRSGPLSREARALGDLLCDATRTVAHIVTLAEEMPVAESVDLYRTLRNEIRIPLGRVVVNALVPDRWDATGPIVERLLKAALPEDLGEILEAARVARSRYAAQRGYLRRLEEEIRLPQVHLPMQFASSLGREEVLGLSRALEWEDRLR